jgi:WD40 repeat protein
VAFSPDESLIATGANDKKINIFDSNFENMVPIKVLTVHREDILALEFSHNGKYLFSCSWDNSIKKIKVEDWSVE